MRSADFQRWIDEGYRREKIGKRLAAPHIRPIPKIEGEEEQDDIATSKSTTNEL